MSAQDDDVQILSGIIIGDELLSGKVNEENSTFLIQELRKLGSQLQSLHMLPDNVHLLAKHLQETSEQCDYVVTSGGLGPTHDDLTMDAVAEAFDVPIVRNETYENALKSVYGDDADETVLEMADMPEGLEFEWGEMLDIPAARFRNIFILPGDPRLFRSKFSAIRDLLRSNQQFYCHNIFLNVKEAEVADTLRDIQEQFPDVDIGSYPSPWSDEYKEMVTIESTSEYEVERAVHALEDRLHPELIVRQEEG